MTARYLAVYRSADAVGNTVVESVDPAATEADVREIERQICRKFDLNHVVLTNLVRLATARLAGESTEVS